MASTGTQAPATGCPVSAEQAKLLATASLKDPEISAYPNEYYAAMRLGDPVHYDEKVGSWLVSRFEDLQTVFRDPETFAAGLGLQMIWAQGYMDEFKEIVMRDGGGYFPTVIPSDPPYHSRVRRLMEKAFTAHRMKSLEPAFTKIAADMIDKLIEKGRCDAVKEFAQPMTIAIICEQLGFDQFDAAKVERWSHAVVQQISAMQSRESMLENAKQICELQNYLIARIRERQAEPREDMTSDLVQAVLEDGSKLTFEETISLVQATMIAGNETTATALTNLFFVLATQPEQTQMLREAADDDRALTKWVEEFLRLYPPVRGLSRATTREAELGGVKLPKHAHMLILFASGNYDETEFACPYEFDMNRGNLGKQLAFGAGSHRCIGLALARMEIKVAARELVKRLEKVTLEIPIEDIQFVPTVATRSMASLPVTLTPRK